MSKWYLIRVLYAIGTYLVIADKCSMFLPGLLDLGVQEDHNWSSATPVRGEWRDCGAAMGIRIRSSVVVAPHRLTVRSCVAQHASCNGHNVNENANANTVTILGHIGNGGRIVGLDIIHKLSQ